jgi:broad specificity phosphatase PhoE
VDDRSIGEDGPHDSGAASGPRLRIVLARHGRPDLPLEARQPICGREIGRWYRSYDASGIVAGADVPAALRDAARAAGCVVASDTRRAIESAARLITADTIRVEASLREVGFPESLDSSLRLSPHLWVFIARAAQMLDRLDDEGGRAAVRARAAAVANTLARLADDHRRVVAIGHGWFNRFVARELRRQGWQGPRFVPSGYWSSVTYERDLGRASAE